MTTLRAPGPDYGSGPVALRLLVPGDADDFLAGLSDPKVHENTYGGRLEPTIEAVSAYLERVVPRFDAGDALVLAAVLRDGGAFLGTTMLFCFEPSGVAEIGFWFAPHARRRGLTEAGIALTIRWGFDALGLRRVQGLTSPDNTASQAAMERAGMVCEGRVRRYLHPKLGRQDVVVYASEED